MPLLPAINTYSVRIADQSAPQQQYLYVAFAINKEAAYAAGAVFAALTASTAASGLATKRISYGVASIGSACLTASMVLLATADDPHSTKVQAHVALEYSGAYMLILASSLIIHGCMSAIELPVDLAAARYRFVLRAYPTLSAVAVIGAVVLECAGVSLAGRRDKRHVQTGCALHLVATCCGLAAAGLGLLIGVWQIRRSAAGRICRSGWWSRVLGNVLLVLWSGFSVAGGVSRLDWRSRAAWFLLGVVPLALAQVVWLVGDMPWAGVLSHLGLRDKRKPDAQPQWSTFALDFSYPLRSGGGRPGAARK
ncbi:hypothetical protein LPJ56_005738 [Coemansia sp. RSA 2599]|nr:hypothetical protein LPJ75_005735 [Coemansia sp. RSA 2598]KAJ1811715.1 hypothetical protein LPJ56_005738 [Coemansia sp. RSA 2599]